jgi:hypothetical protein
MKFRTSIAGSLIAGTLIAGSPVGSVPARAVEGPWCAFESTGFDAFPTRCDLPSFEACRAWTQGMSGTWCTQNPRFAPSSRLPRAGTQRPRTR